jgi:hypothetical protein
MLRDLRAGDALAVVMDSPPGMYGNRGLAMWAIGQLGHRDVLDQLWAEYEALSKQEYGQ